ncbi:bis(5'-nucleosyl)-tetraphosphatase (symmetrical) YqeK [Streptococcus anginosus]|jgi:predicted HD superfamily hydrolase involved in NAD metabolism|uniref:bis(5'-nucleosyl)-tetraphosphatase (symmetrical) n=4 Tax=Streptococcus anginosus TaxID=1328 RepID=A0A412PQB9_STRAP|nr:MULTISPECIES: bis(5'-nucleosyl)-tetraphosphatase (symmetrical) YqeK [Streptococcus]EMG33426.1 metal-dependent phosphohydrolase, HD family protein [Streptococcus oralis subsp. tigurinus AZ_3a]MCW0928356.1 bis(5'-nucleosyl)-tetraphosphatase (symmetrical) YqeK [Streptococcus anginosus]MCW0986924.1 bis(5'-nucleosyl)-tetraphosphatase (symmetrical) YqeK [Streptococcus anginosus]MCW1042227.1 bis(5'-nucleosyl)-tetraphosphatase (symmetrical) YqeK [Streptococcus anginosus]MCW1049259.1 bis(5'-nucleosy
MKEREYLTPVTENFLHAIGVGIESFKLAVEYKLNPVVAFIAGSLHDLGGAIPNKDRVKVAESCGLTLCKEEVEFPLLIHAKQGAYLANKLFGIHDNEILDSILYHTTCVENASDMVKIVFLADKIHWDRNGIPPYLDDLKDVLGISLDKSCEIFLEWLWNDNKKLVIHPLLKNSYDYYCRRKSPSSDYFIEYNTELDKNIIVNYSLDKIQNEYIKIFASLLPIVDNYYNGYTAQSDFYNHFLASVISNSSNTIKLFNPLKIEEYIDIEKYSDNFFSNLNIYFAKNEFNISDMNILNLVDDNSNFEISNIDSTKVISYLINKSYGK